MAHMELTSYDQQAELALHNYTCLVQDTRSYHLPDIDTQEEAAIPHEVRATHHMMSLFQTLYVINKHNPAELENSPKAREFLAMATDKLPELQQRIVNVLPYTLVPQARTYFSQLNATLLDA